MEKLKKTLIQKAVIAPLVIGALTAVLFFSILPAVSAVFPLSDKEIRIAEFEQGQQDTAFKESSQLTDGVQKKADIIHSESNKRIGTVSVNGSDIPLVYDADNVSLTGSLSFMPEGDYIGEVGCAYVYGYNSVVDVNSFSQGQDINAVTDYGSYVFNVVDIRTVSAEHMIYSMNTGTKRGLVLYTNTDSGYGVSSSFNAVIMELKSGPLITE